MTPFRLYLLVALGAVAATIHLALSPPPIPVLLFHDVNPKRASWDFWTISPEKFRELCDLLDRHGYRGLSLEEASRHIAGKLEVARACEGVLITIDDGTRSAASLVGPELAARGQRGAFFVVSGWNAPAHLSRDQIGALAVHHDIGSHGVTHDALAVGKRRPLGTETQRIMDELVRSKRELAGAAGADPLAVAYPKGEHDATTHALTREAGYRMAFTTDLGYLEVGADSAELPRFQLNWDTPGSWIEDYLTHPRRERQRSLRLLGAVIALALAAAFLARPRASAPAKS